MWIWNFGFWVIMTLGYIFNIIKLIPIFEWDGAITVEIAMRIVGIFVPPVGVFMGWFI